MPEPRIVYVIYREYQADTPAIEAVYLSEQLAEGEAQILREQLAEDGEIVEGHNDDSEEDVTLDWTVCIGIQAVHLIEITL